MDNENHKLNMKELQQQFATLYGTGTTIFWDLYTSTEKDAVTNKLKFLIPDDEGDPKIVEQMIQKYYPTSNHQLEKELKQYDLKISQNNIKIAKHRNIILDSIWAQRKYCNKDLLMSIIFVLLAPPDSLLLHEGICSRKYSCHPVFRIRKCKLNDDSQMCCMIFVDEEGRVYQDWEDYLNNNTLPKGVMCFPRHGVYTFDWQDKVELQKYYTPACSKTEAALKATDTGVIVLGATAVIAPITALFAPVALPLIIYSAVASTLSCAWSIGRASAQLADRGFHEQSINITDRQARFSWFSIVGGALGLGASGATQGLLIHAAKGGEIPVLARIAVSGVNAVSLTVNGLSVGNGIIEIIMKVSDDEPISTFDIVQLNTSLVLFTHSVYNFHYVTNIINENSNGTLNQFRNMLGESQRNIFDRFVTETRRLTNGFTNKIDVIRGTGSIPDYTYLNNGTIEGAIPFDTGSVIQAVHLFTKITKTVTRIVNTTNLKNCVSNMLEILTEAAIEMLVEITKTFFQQWGDIIENELRRIIPFEEGLWRSFNIARDLLGVENISVETLKSKLKVIIQKLRDLYEANKVSSNTPNIKCKKCRGYYTITPC